jgi:hypothetical protein
MAKTKNKKKKIVEKADVRVEEKATTKAKEFRFEVIVNDVHFKTKSDSLAEALNEFMSSKEFPAAIKTKVILRFGKGETLVQRLWPVSEARRVFANLGIKPELSELFAEKLSRQL